MSRVQGSVWIALVLALALSVGCSGARTLPLISAAGAVYPPDARAEGVEGYVVVGYDVDAEGRVVNARVVDSTPPGVFDESALAAVSRWRFQPPGAEAAPVTGLTSRLDFTIDDGGRYDDY